jgi:hypothetical protein
LNKFNIKKIFSIVDFHFLPFLLQFIAWRCSLACLPYARSFVLFFNGNDVSFCIVEDVGLGWQVFKVIWS